MKALGIVVCLVFIAAVLTHDTSWLHGIVSHATTDLREAWRLLTS